MSDLPISTSVAMMLVVVPRVEEYENVAIYFEKLLLLLDHVGAYLGRPFQLNEVFIGRKVPRSLLIITFPDRAAMWELFNSEGYHDIIPLQGLAFAELHAFMAAN